jgi:fatty-acyl-CoA synthase
MADTLQQLLRERSEQDTIAVKYGDRTWTWREHVAEARAQAAAIIDIADSGRALHVGVLLANGPEMLTAMAAAALGGYVLCCINNTRRGEGLARDISLVDCQILITDAGHRHLLDHLDLPGVRVLDTSSDEWASFTAEPRDLTPHREVGPDDTFVMIFTSGTSGDPKAVQVQHMMPIFAGTSLAQRYSVSTSDV